MNPTNISIVINLICFFGLMTMVYFATIKVIKNHFANGVWRVMLIALTAWWLSDAGVHLAAMISKAHLIVSGHELPYLILGAESLEAIVVVVAGLSVYKHNIELYTLTHIKQEETNDEL